MGHVQLQQVQMIDDLLQEIRELKGHQANAVHIHQPLQSL